MKMYHELAQWWPLISAPEEYAEEAALYHAIIEKHKSGIRDALELGSGGGCNAFYLKKHYDLTLVDLSPAMLGVSRKLNPECTHIEGDMRTVDLERRFDLVFIHDAIMYMTTTRDLSAVFDVAYKHLQDDGLLFIAPDFFKETFKPSTSHGGHDGDGIGIRYLEWTTDCDPEDNLTETEYVYLIREADGHVRIEHDHDVTGIFSKTTWQELLENAGFSVAFELIEHSELDPGSYYGITAQKQHLTTY